MILKHSDADCVCGVFFFHLQYLFWNHSCVLSYFFSSDFFFFCMLCRAMLIQLWIKQRDCLCVAAWPCMAHMYHWHCCSSPHYILRTTHRHLMWPTRDFCPKAFCYPKEDKRVQRRGFFLLLFPLGGNGGSRRPWHGPLTWKLSPHLHLKPLPSFW